MEEEQWRELEHENEMETKKPEFSERIYLWNCSFAAPLESLDGIRIQSRVICVSSVGELLGIIAGRISELS